MIDKVEFWCQKVLPTMYDNSLSYYEALCRLAERLNEVIEKMNSLPEAILNSDEFKAMVQEGVGNEVDRLFQEVQDALDGFETQLDAINTTLEKLPVGNNSNVLTVGAKGCMFTTINAAIAEAKKYCNTNNRVVILIFGGTYNEEINLLANPGIDIVGVGDVIVQYASVYPNSPLHTTGRGYFSNIYFRALSSTTPSYAMHIEAQEDNTASSITLEDCNFFSDAQSAVGIGLGTNFEVTLKGCNLISTAGSGLYCHNYPGPATNQVINCVDCLVSGTTDIHVDDALLLAGGSVGQGYFTVNVIGGTGYHNSVALKVAANTVYKYWSDNVSNLVIGKQNSCRGLPGADYYLRALNYTQDAYFSNGNCAVPMPDNLPRKYTVSAINPKTAESVPVTVTPVRQTLNVVASGFTDGVLRLTISGLIDI